MKSANAKREREARVVQPPPRSLASKLSGAAPTAKARPETYDASTLSKRTAALKAWIDAKPGAEGQPFSPRKGSPPLVLIYKVMGKMFAILSVRGVEDVIVKCDPTSVSALREQYAGVGHRSHLDRRFWISVRLDSDVPMKEIRRLVSLSYDLVCAKLTAKQKAELARTRAVRVP
jgi:predicted DNA-binding protein (MmcQ/YjbR family)